MLRPLSVGEILDTSFSLYRRHFGALATVSLVCTGLPLVLRLFVEAAGGLFAHLTLALVYMLSLVVLSLIATGATVFIVSESYLGRPLTAREALMRAAPYMGRILIASLLMALVIGFGFILMVIPGIILGVGLAVAIPAVVLEVGRSASGALSRSWELTRGSRWRIFGLGLTLFVLLYVPVIAISGLVAVLAPRGGAAAFGTSSTATIVALAIGGVVQLFIYPLF